MSKNIMYTGLGKYNQRESTVNYKIIIFFVLIFIIAFVIAINILSKDKKIITSDLGITNDTPNDISIDINIEDIDNIKLEQEDIEFYIGVSEKISYGKGQIDWREVAAINEVIGNGEKEEEALIALSDYFYGEEEGDILAFNDVLKKLELSKDNMEEALVYFIAIGENSLHEGLYGDLEKVDFINSIKEIAIENYKEYKILPSITMGQAILESGWGKSELTEKSNNLFGIKADSRWDGAVETVETGENYDDIITANFRKYDSIEESVKDHGLFLYVNERYRNNGIFDGKEYISQAQALENAGYSTAKDKDGELIYADKLIGVIQKYNLMIYDTEAIRE